MPEICLMTKSWRYSSGWIAQSIAQSIAQQGATIAFIAPRAEPADREPEHVNLTRIRPPRELVGSYPRHQRVAASLGRIALGCGKVIALRANTRSFIFTIPEPLIFTLPIFLLLRLTGAKVIYIVHDAKPHAWSLPRSLQRLERAAHRWAYGLSSTLVTLTPSVRTALAADFGISLQKVQVIPHGPLAMGDVAPVPGSGKLLIFGALRRNKGLLDAIRGIVQARRDGRAVVLILAGEPLREERGYWDECVAAMAEDPAGFDVRVGFVKDESLPALIGEVDAFVLAYRDFHSQSGVAVLAALAGRPVIGTRAGGLGELFDLGMVGCQLDNAFTPLSFAAAVEAFYAQDAAHWRVSAKAGAERIASTLRWDRIADAYIALARDQPLPAF